MTDAGRVPSRDDEDWDDQVQEAITDAADHPALESTARVGYVANAGMHVLIGVVAVRLAAGVPGGPADQGGALSLLTRHTWGFTLLVVGALGWLALAFWQVGEACRSRYSLGTRAKAVAKGITYAVLAGMCVSYLRHDGGGSSHKNVEVTARVMSSTLGVLVIGAVGLGIMGVGGYHVLKGLRRSFLDDLDEDPGPLISLTGVVGYVLKGLGLVLTGGFVVNAARTHDADDAGGLDTALRRTLDHAWGPGVVGAVGVGFIIFAVYSAARARFTRV